METKYYAPKNQVDCLTITTHPGKYNEMDVVNNLMRMMVMDETEEGAEAATQIIQEMNPEERQELRDSAETYLGDWDFQRYLNSHPLPKGQELLPIAEALKDEDLTPTEEEAMEAMWEIVDEFSLSELEAYRMDESATRD